MPTLNVRPQGLPGLIADGLMMPLMFALQGFALELPQRTHRWNNTKFKNGKIGVLRRDLMVTSQGDPSAGGQWFGVLPVMHLPLFVGGWREYVVLEPARSVTSWYIGWIAEEVSGISRIPLQGPVKVLRGPGPAHYFGINAETECQIRIHEIGSGSVGSGAHRFIPLR